MQHQTELSKPSTPEQPVPGQPVPGKPISGKPISGKPPRESATLLAKVDGVRVVFEKLVAVADMSFELRAGDLLGLIGPNGAGKTTLLRAMAGLQSPTSGRTEIMGEDVFGRSRNVRRHIGFAPDSPPVYEEMTVLQFLTFIGHAYDIPTDTVAERIDYWLEQLWLTDKRDEPIKNLSRGMKQRITVARTLLPDPLVILLDEPSAGLDPAGRIQFRKVLASLRDMGRALIVSSHILADLEEYCTHIAIIEHGRFLRFGRVEDLHDRAEGRSRYRMTVARADEAISELLAGIEGVSEIVHATGANADMEWVFEYHDDKIKAAGLLREIVQRSVLIASFEQLGDSLEQVYLDAGVKQVD